MQDTFVEDPCDQGGLLVTGRQTAILNVPPGIWFSNGDQLASHRVRRGPSKENLTLAP